MDATTVLPLFPTTNQGSIPASPRQLELRVISINLAVELNKLWHSRLPKIHATNIRRNKDYICFGFEYENEWFACAIWSSPIVRAYNHKGYLELRRFAIRDDAPRNTATFLLKLMRNHIKETLPDIVKLISYQETDVHHGTIYKADNWAAIGYRPDGNWNMPGRRRVAPAAPGAKIRWEYDLR